MSQETTTPTSVLIVEDDRFLRDLIQQKLTKEGFTTISAVDGEEGLKITKEQKPHLVLLDLILPGMDGFEVLRKIKSDPETAATPVVVLSNLGQKEDVEKGMAFGVKDYVIKAHHTPSEVVVKIKQILGS